MAQFDSPPGLSVREIAVQVAGRLAELGCAEVTLMLGQQPGRRVHAHDGVDLPGELARAVERDGSVTIEAACGSGSINVSFFESGAVWTGPPETAPSEWPNKAD